MQNNKQFIDSFLKALKFTKNLSSFVENLKNMQVIDNNRVIRNNFVKVCDSVGIANIIKIPNGFKNHILWNFAHAVVTQNILVYQMSGLPYTLPEEFVAAYRKGTFPTEIPNPQKELYQVIALAEKAEEQLNKDIREMIFDDYKPYETSFGVTLKSFNEALQFNNIHAGMHLGYAMAIRKALGY